MVLLLVFIILHIAVLSKLVFLPYPELFVYPYLTNKGLVPYTQILDQHFPGLMFFPVNLNSLGVLTPNDARIWQLGLVVITHLLIFSVAKKIFRSNKAALVSNFFYLIWQPYFEGWVLWIDNFIPIFLLTALYFLVNFLDKKKKLNLLLSGLFLGLALVLKQVVLPLILVVGLFILFKTRNFRESILFGFGAFIPFSFMLLYILSLGVWDDFVFWTFKFNLTTYAQMGRKYATIGDLTKVLVAYGLPLIIFFYFLAKNKSAKNILIIIFFICSLIFAYARFDPVHLQPSLVFIALVSGYCVLKMPKQILLIAIVFYIIPTVILLSKFYSSHIGDKVFFWGDFEQSLVNVVQKETSPNEKIFAFATTPNIYSMADRLPPGNVFVFHFPWFFKAAETQILKGLVGDPPKVVLRDKEAMVDGEILVKHAPFISDYIDKNYYLLEFVDKTEVLVRK